MEYPPSAPPCGADHGLARLGHHFVDDAAAAVEGSVVGAAELEICGAFDGLRRSTVGQAGDGCSDRGRDHLITGRDRCIKRAAAIETTACADIDDGTRRRLG